MRSRLFIGQIRSPHGLKGEVNVQSFSGEYKHIRALKKACLLLGNEEAEHEIVSIRGRGETCIVLFAGIDSRDKAIEYRGAKIIVARKCAAPLARGEYYCTDLVQCRVVFENKEMGHVISVWENGNCDMLEVERSNGAIVQVPLQDRFIAGINIQKRVITLAVDWILE